MADTSKITLRQLKDAMNKAKNYTDNEIAGVTGVSTVEPEALDMPKVFFNGDKPTDKTAVHATIEYISKTQHFKGYVDIKCQGTSSMAYPKKNYTIKMFSDETRSTKLKKDFKGWGKQSKFCLKANYIDHSHARNIVSAKLWGQVVKSRSDFDSLPEEFKTSPNYGAVDGFPIKVYYNNTYEGVYTWNIPKDGWMNNMDDKLNTHCILCGEEYNSGCFRSANASLWSDELHDTMPANIVTSFNNFQNFVINSSDDEFKTGLSTYADVNSLIDYYIFQYVICGLDSMGKNQLFFTYDGIKWIASSYDMDSTFGLYWNGQRFVSATYRMQEDYESGSHTTSYNNKGNLLYVRMEELFCDEIKARYTELRAGVLSYANIVNEFERFMDTIGKDLYAEDLTIYTGIPSGSTNNIQQIRNYTRDRLTYVDTQIEALRKLIPCTGIVLSTDTLSFTTTDTQTLEAVVSPSDTTDAVVWSVSPNGVATVVDGVVTPVANGTCTITATCGSKSDTCSVTVSLPVVECSSINLNKDTLNLGIIEAPETENLVDLQSIGGSYNASYFISNEFDAPKGIYRLEVLPDAKFRSVALKLNSVTMCSVSKGESFPVLVATDNSKIKIECNASDVSLNEQFENIRLYQINKEYSMTKTDLSFTYSQMGYLVNGIIKDSSQDMVSNKITLDSNKKYCVVSTTTYMGTCVALYSNNQFVRQYASTTSTNRVINYLVQDADSVQVSMRGTDQNVFNDWEIFELSSNDAEYLSEQLTATVTPDNCTQPVVWSVSPEGIVTVVDGLVTAKANGEATITATCGSYSDTCAVTVSGMSESGENANLVFQVNSTSMNTSDNTLTDNIAGISATLTGNPTVSDNQITFTANDKFSFDLSSLSLNASNRTLRVKFTPTSLNTDFKNTFIFGETANSWNSATTVYIRNDKLVMQHGSNSFANVTVGGANAGGNANRLSSTPTINTEYEIVISENVTTNEVRWFANGTLVQDGTATLFNPLYLTNIEGATRFIGNYSLIEIYNKYCNDYTEFTNMVNNTSSGEGTDIYETAEYAITEARTFNGTSDYIDTGIKLFDTAKTFTIFVDYTSTTASETAAALFHCVHEASPYRGLCMMKLDNSDKYFIGGQASGQNNYDANLPATGKYIISFVNGVINNVATVDNSGELVYSATNMASKNPYVQISENLLIGCYQNTSGTKGRYWSGTINKFGLWYKQLTSDEINKVFGKSGESGGNSDVSDGYMSYMIQYQSEPSVTFALHSPSTSTDCQGFECSPSFNGFAFPTNTTDTDTSYMICDGMPTVTDSEKKVNNIPCIAGAYSSPKNYLTVKVLKANASTTDEFKTYFRENPTYIKIKPKDTVHKYSIDINNVEMLNTTHTADGYTCGEFIVNDLPTTNYTVTNVFMSDLGFSDDWRNYDWSYFKIGKWQGNVYVGFQIKNELLETQDLEGIRKYIAKDPNIYYIN